MFADRTRNKKKKPRLPRLPGHEPGEEKTQANGGNRVYLNIVIANSPFVSNIYVKVIRRDRYLYFQKTI